MATTQKNSFSLKVLPEALDIKVIEQGLIGNRHHTSGPSLRYHKTVEPIIAGNEHLLSYK
ncbi:hypothetical protein FHW92_002476 [Novosphingobium sp. SG707]|nr:hypothetical protein [Novosphingobium sp. SG707]